MPDDDSTYREFNTLVMLNWTTPEQDALNVLAAQGVADGEQEGGCA